MEDNNQDIPKLKLETMKEFKERYRNRKTVLWPWETKNWAMMEERLNRKIASPEELKQIICEISNEQTGSFFEAYFSQDDEKTKTFFESTLPFIQSLALKLPSLFTEESPLLILIPQYDATITLSKEQVAGILAHAFFGTFERVNPVKFTGFEFPILEFQTLQHQTWHISAMECILHYFTRISKESNYIQPAILNSKVPKGNLIVQRQVLRTELDWKNSTTRIRKVTVSSQGTIEDSDAQLHADFANEYIGGGVLHGGLVQEEILFLIKPECLVTLLFCAKMDDNEAIIITGAERFSSYSGYGGSFKFAGDFVDLSPRDDNGTILRQIAAYDAIVAFGSALGQFNPKVFKRDLEKAYCAFYSPGKQDLPDLATGNWGCGAFGGNKHLKAIQQILAASEAGRNTLYFTFKDKKLEEAISHFLRVLEEKEFTVGQLYSLYTQNIAKYDSSDGTLFDYLVPLISELQNVKE